VVVVLVVVLSSGPKSRSSAPASLPPLLTRSGPEAIFSPGPLVLLDAVGTLDELQRLGVDRVRIFISWNAVAPDPAALVAPAGFNAADPAAYPAANWAMYDAALEDARARGMGVDVTLGPPPPRWASGKGAPNPSTQTEWRPSAAQYGLFVSAVATRYSGHYVPPGASAPLPRVAFWSIWNEPNLGVYLAPEAIDNSTLEVSPRYYRAIVDAAWSALQSTGHGQDTVLIGELAPAGQRSGGPGNFNAMPALRFLRALYCVDAAYRPLRGTAAALRGCPTDAAGSARFGTEHPGLFHASGVADHPYSQGLPPNEVTPDEPDYAELAALPTLERVLDTMQRVYGSNTRFPIYSTEFGYQTTPPDTEYGTVSLALAAYYLNWAEYLTWRDPRVRSYDQYELVDPPLGNFASALEFSNGVPKPSFYAYRMPIYLPVTATASGHPLYVWGCVRPARYAGLDTGRAQRVQIQLRAGSGGAFRTVGTVRVTNRYGYFNVLQTFPESGLVRLRWSPPHGPAIVSRTVAISLQ
jgi:hypothetical protein